MRPRFLARLALCVGLGLATAELGTRALVEHALGRGKIFHHDARLGWSVQPELDLVRTNADGEPWRVSTGPTGLRGPHAFAPPPARRLLILGDSFAFGEGVDWEERFDALLLAEQPGWSAVNTGVMGYGTDQQLLASAEHFDELRAGDALVLLTFVNDYWDLARRRHAARSKPWFELRDDELVHHAPSIGPLEVLRDTSQLCGLFIARLCPRNEHPDESALAQSAALYARLLERELTPLLARGVRVLIAHHGSHVGALPFDEAALHAQLRALGFELLDLDPAVGDRERSGAYLADGHWNALGHARVARALGAWLAPGSS